MKEVRRNNVAQRCAARFINKKILPVLRGRILCGRGDSNSHASYSATTSR
jgi:hypothetical protein